MSKSPLAHLSDQTLDKLSRVSHVKMYQEQAHGTRGKIETPIWKLLAISKLWNAVRRQQTFRAYQSPTMLPQQYPSDIQEIDFMLQPHADFVNDVSAQQDYYQQDQVFAIHALPVSQTPGPDGLSPPPSPQQHQHQHHNQQDLLFIQENPGHEFYYYVTDDQVVKKLPEGQDASVGLPGSGMDYAHMFGMPQMITGMNDDSENTMMTQASAAHFIGAVPLGESPSHATALLDHSHVVFQMQSMQQQYADSVAIRVEGEQQSQHHQQHYEPDQHSEHMQMNEVELEPEVERSVVDTARLVPQRDQRDVPMLSPEPTSPSASMEAEYSANEPAASLDPMSQDNESQLMSQDIENLEPMHLSLSVEGPTPMDLDVNDAMIVVVEPEQQQSGGKQTSAVIITIETSTTQSQLQPSQQQQQQQQQQPPQPQPPQQLSPQQPQQQQPSPQQPRTQSQSQPPQPPQTQTQPQPESIVDPNMTPDSPGATTASILCRRKRSIDEVDEPAEQEKGKVAKRLAGSSTSDIQTEDEAASEDDNDTITVAASVTTHSSASSSPSTTTVAVPVPQSSPERKIYSLRSRNKSGSGLVSGGSPRRERVSPRKRNSASSPNSSPSRLSPSAHTNSSPAPSSPVFTVDVPASPRTTASPPVLISA